MIACVHPHTIKKSSGKGRSQQSVVDSSKSLKVDAFVPHRVCADVERVNTTAMPILLSRVEKESEMAKIVIRKSCSRSVLS